MTAPWGETISADTIHWGNVVQSRGRWINIKPPLRRRLVFAGLIKYNNHDTNVIVFLIRSESMILESRDSNTSKGAKREILTPL